MQNSNYRYDPSIIPLNVISLCRLEVPREGTVRIVRCGDFRDGKIIPFIPDSKFAFCNSNRNYFEVSENFPECDQEWAVWNLTTTPLSGGRDHYEVHRRKNGSLPIVVHRLRSQTPVLEQLTGDLLERMFDMPHPFPVLFTYRKEQKLLGIYIRPDQVSKDIDGQFQITNTWTLPQYELNEKAIIPLNGFYLPVEFWSSLSLGTDAVALDERFCVTPPIQALAETISKNYCSWKQYHQTFIGERRDYKALNSLIELLKKPEIKQQLNAHYPMGVEAFEKLKEELIVKAETFLNGLDVSTDVLLNAALRRPGMEATLGEAAERKWKTEHQQEIATANRELETIKESIEKNQRALKQLSDQVNTETMRLQQVKEKRQSEEAMVDAVTAKFDQNLQTAQSRFVDLLADLPFRFALQKTLNGASSLSSENHLSEDGHIQKNDTGTSTTIKSNDLSPLFAQPTPKKEIPLADTSHEWLKISSTMLCSAGIKKYFALGLSQLLTATTLKGTPILVAGPNSCAVARMMALSLTGMPPVVVNLDETKLEEVLAQIDGWDTSSGYSPFPPVVIFRNAMAGSRLSTLLDDWRLAKCTPIITTTFSDEIALYPSALLNSVFPILTELLATADFRPNLSPKRLVRAGYDLFEEWSQQDPTETAVPSAFEEVPLPPLARTRQEGIMALAGVLFEPEMRQHASETFLLCLAAAAVLLSPNPTATSEHIQSVLLPLIRTESAESLQHWLDSRNPEQMGNHGVQS